MIERGGVYWADLGPAAGSRPAKRRPVLIIQSDGYNESRLATVLVAVITSNTALSVMPGNVFLPSSASGLLRDSVVNVTALATINKAELEELSGHIPEALLDQVDSGLRRVLNL